jgi:hypothetical protein
MERPVETRANRMASTLAVVTEMVNCHCARP